MAGLEILPVGVSEAFGLDSGPAARIPLGRINAHWRVRREGRPFVLRRYAETRSAASIAWEQALVRQAGAKGWPVAETVPTAAGPVVECGGRHWSLAPELPGRPQREPSAAAFGIRGRLLARLHQDLGAFSEGQRAGAGKLWELDAWLEPTGAGSFNEVLGAFAHEYGEVAATVRRYRYRNLRELARLRYPDLADRPIHGDFQGDNLLWRDGTLSGLLDFDFARMDAQVVELAIMLVPFAPLDERRARALVEGYDAVRPLSDGERELLPALARAALLWWIAQLLGGWRTGANPSALAGIVRTATSRLPALDAAEAGLRAAFMRPRALT